jgi:hypothetical protein
MRCFDSSTLVIVCALCVVGHIWHDGRKRHKRGWVCFSSEESLHIWRSCAEEQVHSCRCWRPLHLHAATEVGEKFNQRLEGWNSLNGLWSLWKSCFHVCQGGFGGSGHDVIKLSSRELLIELNIIKYCKYMISKIMSDILMVLF